MNEWMGNLSANKDALAYSASLDANFADCFVNGNCTIDQTQTFNLYQNFANRPAAGANRNPVRYDDKGRRCNAGELGCDLRALALYTPKCYDSVNCTSPDYIVVRVELWDDNNRVANVSNIITYNQSFNENVDDQCNPGDPDRSRTIVVNFQNGRVLCGLSVN